MNGIFLKEILMFTANGDYIIFIAELRTRGAQLL